MRSAAFVAARRLLWPLLDVSGWTGPACALPSRLLVQCLSDPLDTDGAITLVDVIPAPLLHMLPPPPRRAAVRGSEPSVLRSAANSERELAIEAARVASVSDEAWLASLPPASRAVLEAARRGPGPWPLAPRADSAVARPVSPRKFPAASSSRTPRTAKVPETLEVELTEL